jgi:hypothetical protein
LINGELVVEIRDFIGNPMCKWSSEVIIQMEWNKARYRTEALKRKF